MPVDESPVAEASPPPVAAGAMLAAARESAGLSVESVAAQLKLAPRQVRALESGDFSALPGRTFVRGFVRNYARHLGIDAERVLAALPDDSDPALSHPHLAGGHRAMGEIPAEHERPRSLGGWLIALALAAIVAAAVLYEQWRPAVEREPKPAAPATGGAKAPASAAAAGVSPATAPDAAPANSTATSPAPAAGAPTDSAAPSPAATPSTPAASAAPPPASEGTPLPNPATRPPNQGAATPGPAAPSLGEAGGAPSRPTAGSSSDASMLATLELAFRGTSWVDVKDARGASLLTLTGSAGTSRSLDAAPPLELIVGNAPDVDVRFRGTSVDLKPWMRQNVARLTLR